ncbi:ShlB/FhaC/HecB family hemolysin secretion/activation protein [Craterilacuibacter sp. RT1T]|uniref:ShlB/FhaC/HecB family hemolysin secretion/activation protein n=1 Tax=Craterilacuibacter sp. RT1T TaxID=2942211 RepID=UPI0020BED273|nr:ShlB/FhaC/HecB family hemolysin secretion/activation protein [Craterilacuibacter sp. RT1T]MCL6262246.1 BamA/TamA family outer membrane protein [Craterilacuibacter sp. RT1T]
MHDTLTLSMRPLLLAFALMPVAALATQAGPGFTVTAYQLTDANPLTPDDTRRVLAPYTGANQTIASLQQAAAALQKELAARGHGFYRVILPPQTVDGTVRLQLILLPVGDISVFGNQHFSTPSILNALPGLQSSQSPDTRKLARNLAQFNDHPAHRAVLTLSESREREAIDVKVSVEDEKPWLAFASLQNNGNASTGKWRLSVGAQASRLFDTDQQLTASYTTSPDEHRQDVSQFGASWKLPLYALATDLSAYAVYSNVDSGTVGGFFDVAGQGHFYGVRASYHLPLQGKLRQSVALALDSKSFTNQVLFAGDNLGSDVGTRPLTLAWNGQWQDAASQLDASLDWAHNLPGGSDNDDLHYGANRAGATRNWQAWHGGLNASMLLPRNWSLNSRLQGQYSRDALIPGEQFGLGGSSSVRGYQEREVSGERGYFAALECWTPLLRPTLRGLLFVDAGQVSRIDPQAGEDARSALASLGAGLRWQPHKLLGLSLDLARPLKDGPSTRAGTWRAHALASARF